MAEQISRTPQGKPPVTRHPLFPAIVALWFGALFGLGSLAIRPTLIEDLVIASHLDALVPSAAPPLGMTSRMLLALGLALIGGIAGASIARRIARPKIEVRPRRRGASVQPPARQGYGHVRDHDYDDDEDDDAVNTRSAPKRRSLAMEEENLPLELREFAPLPGGQPQILNMSDVGLDGIEDDTAAPQYGATATFAPSAEAARPASEGTAAFSHGGADFAALQPAEPVSSFARQEFAPREFARQEAPRQEFAAAAPAGQRGFGQPDTAQAAATPASGLAAPRPFAAPTIALPVSPPLDLTRPFEVAMPEAAAQAIAAPEAIAPAAPAATPRFTPASGSAADHVAAADLGALSHVQLIERLALSLQRRRARVQANADVAVELAEAAAPAATPPASFAAPPLPVFVEAVVPAPLAMPSALRPISFEEPGEDEDDSILPGFLPPRQIVLPRPFAEPAAVSMPASEAKVAPETDAGESQTAAAVAEHAEHADHGGEDDGDEHRALEDGYSSLLNLSKPAAPRQQFIRIEDADDDDNAAIEPVVVFPGQMARIAGQQANAVSALRRDAAPGLQDDGPPSLRRFDGPAEPAGAARPVARQDAEESERALRAALATLQRMSGAA